MEKTTDMQVDQDRDTGDLQIIYLNPINATLRAPFWSFDSSDLWIFSVIFFIIWVIWVIIPKD